MRKRLMAMVMSLVMIVCFMPTFGFAADGDPVAKIGDTEYESLTEAIAAVPTDGTETEILLLDNIAVDGNDGYTIATGQNVVLDLNGKTITQNAPNASVSYLFKNNGTLTINDGVGGGGMEVTAGIPSTSYGYANNVITNSSQLTINAGSYIQNTSGKGAYYCLDNYPGADTVINAGTFTNNGTSTAIRMFTNSTTVDTKVVINGGTVEGGYFAVQVQNPNANANKATLVINGGTFSTTDTTYKMAVYAGNGSDYTNFDLSIRGGTFQNDVAFAGAIPEENIEVSGGTFLGEYGCYGYGNQKFITGGTFNADVSEYCAEGFVLHDNGDGTYGVVEYFAAQIGDTKYKTLQEAIAAVPTDGTETEIILLEDIVAGENDGYTISTGQNVVLDLNGKTLSKVKAETLTKNDALIEVKKEATLTINDSGTGGSIEYQYTGESTHWGKSSSAISNNQGTVVVNGGIVKNLTTVEEQIAYAIDNLTNSSIGPATLIINGGTVENVYYRAIRLFANCNTWDNTLTINGGTIVSGGNDAIALQSSNNTANRGTININGGTINSIDGKGIYLYTGANTTVAPVSNMAITGGEINCAIRVNGPTFPSEVTISGGTFTVMPDEEYLADNFVLVDNGDGTYGVVEFFAAQIGDTKYHSLAEAVAAVPTGSEDPVTIQMIADEELDASEKITVAKNQNIILDLNGKRISKTQPEKITKNDHLLINKGTLEITDSGTGGVIEYTYTGESTNWGYASNTVSNEQGELTLNGGTILNNTTVPSQIAFAIDNVTNSGIGPATLTINGGTVENVYYRAIRQFANCYVHANTVNVNGGTVISGENDAIWLQSPNGKANIAALNISGGTVSSGREGRGIYADTDDNNSSPTAPIFSVDITGGTIDCAIRETGTTYPSDISISGGTFTVMPAEEYLADNFVLVDNGDGTYGVKEFFEAQIGETKYHSLTEAIAAVPTDGTETGITLLEDIVLDENNGYTIAAGQNVVLDLNGKTITQNAPEAKVSYLFKNNGALTINDSAGGGFMDVTAAIPSTGFWYANNIITNSGQLTVNAGSYIQNTTGNGAYYCIDNYPGADTVINDGTFTNNGTATAIRMFANSTTVDTKVTLNGGTVEGGYFAVQVQNPNANANKATLVINDGTFSTTDETYNLAVYAGSGSHCTNFDITIKGGTFQDDVAFSGSIPEENIEVSGGTYLGEYGCYSYGTQKFITGGTFNTDVSDYCAEGFIVKQNEDGTYGVVEYFAAQIGDTKYKTLEEAMAAAQAGDTVTLLNPVVLNSQVEVAEGIILDMGPYTIAGDVKMNGGVIKSGGVTMTGPADAAYITNDALFGFGDTGNITVKSGSVVLGGGMCTMPGQTLTLAEGASFKIPKGITLDVYSDIVNNGTFIIDGTMILYDSKEYGPLINVNPAAYAAAQVAGILGKGSFTGNAPITERADYVIEVTEGKTSTTYKPALDEEAVLSQIEELTNSLAEKEAQLAELTERINTLNATIAAQEVTINNQSDRIEALEQTVADQTETIEAQTEEIATLQATIAVQNGLITNLENQVAALEGEVQTLQNEITGLNDQIDDLTTTIGTQNDQIVALQQTVTNLNNQIADLNDTIAQQNTEITNLNNQITALNNQIADLNTTIDGLREEIENLTMASEESIAELRAEVRRLTALINAAGMDPGKVNVKLYGHDNIHASWTEQTVPDETLVVKYKVEYKRSTWDEYSVFTEDTTDIYYKTPNLKDGVAYQIKVTPYFEQDDVKYYGKAGYSSYIYTLKKIAAPTLSKASKYYVRLKWTNIRGESGYQISRSKYKTKGFSTVKRVSYKYSTTTAKTTRNVTYYYKIRAYKTVDGKRIYAPWSNLRAYKLR